MNITLHITASNGSGEENNLEVVEENKDHPRLNSHPKPKCMHECVGVSKMRQTKK